MFRLKNISLQHVTLVRVTKDNGLEYILVKPNNYVDLTNLSEFLNITNLLDPHMGIFKVSLVSWKDVKLNG